MRRTASPQKVPNEVYLDPHQEFKGCIALAEADENSALESDTIPEAEVVHRVKEAQALKAVYTARASRAERSLPSLITELEAACVGAERQLLERIADESAKRREVIKQRVLDVLDIEGDPDVLIRIELNTCVRHSRGVRAIESLRPAGYFEPGNAEHASRRALRFWTGWEDWQRKLRKEFDMPDYKPLLEQFGKDYRESRTKELLADIKRLQRTNRGCRLMKPGIALCPLIRH
jgi:hypothetical protein